MNEIMLSILVRLKNNRVCYFIINYIKKRHPNVWNKIKNNIMTFIVNKKKQSIGNNISDYEKIFINRIEKKINYYKKER